MNVLEVKHITKSFGALRAVDDVSLALAKGETMGIVGESGCGKSTLAKVITGLIRPDRGEVIAASKVQMVFQDPFSSLDPMYPVSAILHEAFYAQPQVWPPARHELIDQALIDVGLSPDVLGRFPHEFSGGQRQRIAIARALLTKPSVLILDEPTSALDVLVQKQIIDLLADLRGRFGFSCLFISHNLRVVKGFSDRIAVMHRGRIIEQGRTADVLASPREAYTRQLLSAAFTYTVDQQ